MNADLNQELEARLRTARADWEHRLQAIQADRRRTNAPLDPDFEEQAVQRENDETLDALDERGRQELVAIEAALGRMAAGSYGRCLACDEAIAPERLRAQPTAATCAACTPGTRKDAQR